MNNYKVGDVLVITEDIYRSIGVNELYFSKNQKVIIVGIYDDCDMHVRVSKDCVHALNVNDSFITMEEFKINIRDAKFDSLIGD